MNASELTKHIGMAVGAAACYFIAGWTGLAFAIPPGNATVIWPASGIAVATLLLLGSTLWPVVWVASCLVSLTTHVPFVLAAAFATGNTIEAIVAAYLLKRFLREPPFVNAKDVFVFIIITIASCVPAATGGAFSLMVAGRIDISQLGINWFTWLLGDLTGLVVVVPLVLAFYKKRWGIPDVGRLAELLLLFSLQIVLSFFLFGGLLSERLAEQVLYLPMVLLVWCSLRFGLVQVTAGTLLFCTAAIWGTCAGVGVYGTISPQDLLFDLQYLLLTYAMTSLVVSSIVASQKHALSVSIESQAELQQQTTERRRVEKWFKQLLTASPDALIMSDAQGQILLANESAERLFGYSRAEMIGQPIEILVPPGQREMHRQHRRHYIEAPYVRLMGSGLELTARRKDGSEFCAEITLGPTSIDDGLVVFSAVRDITSRKKTEKALRDSEERFDLAVRGTDAGIWDWDLRTDKVYFSPRWKSILGYQDDEIQHEFKEWEDRLHPEDREQALKTVRAYLDGKSPDYELEHRLRHKDGSFRWILARGAVVRDASGKPYRMAGSHLDITERRHMEERLRVQLGQLIAAEEIQSHLLPDKSPQIPGLDIAGKCYPAEFAAGDHFDFLFLRNGLFVPVISDVAGHGVGPAILMASLHAHLRSLSNIHSEFCEVLVQLNNILKKESSAQHFVTLLATIFDCRTQTMSYVRCGHPPGFVMSAQGEVLLEMEDGSLPLGILPDTQFSQSESTQLHSGDLVVMVTDGLLEAFSPDRVQYGIDRTIQTVRKYRDQSAIEIIEAVRKSITQYTGKEALSDDVTLVVIKAV